MFNAGPKVRPMTPQELKYKKARRAAERRKRKAEARKQEERKRLEAEQAKAPVEATPVIEAEEEKEQAQPEPVIWECEYVFQESDPEYGQFHSRVTFESDATSDGMTSTTRESAVAKFLHWREKLIGNQPSNIRKARRLITLMEGEPSGPEGEAGHWGSKVKYLRRRLKTLCPGSHITMIVEVSANPRSAAGEYKEWMESMLSLLKGFPQNFAVRVEKNTVRSALPASFYPQDDFVQRNKGYTKEYVVSAFGRDGDYVDDDQLRAYINTLNGSYYRTRMEHCERIDVALAFCRKFAHDVKYYGEHGEWPPLPVPVVPSMQLQWPM